MLDEQSFSGCDVGSPLDVPATKLVMVRVEERIAARRTASAFVLVALESKDFVVVAGWRGSMDHSCEML
jgi:hypothetical protein